MLSFSLKKQLDSVFQRGLSILIEKKDSIQREWKIVLEHLKNTDIKLEVSLQHTISFLSRLFDKEENGYITKQNESWLLHLPDVPKTNQFIITLLENAVHKVIQSDNEYSQYDHQAIQYFFTTISEHVLTQPYYQQTTLNHFLKFLVSSQQLPIEWAAIIQKDHEKYYYVKNWFNKLNRELLIDNEKLRASSIFTLTDLLIQKTPKEQRNKQTIFPIPFEEHTLLFCTYKEETSSIIPFINFALENFKKGRDAIIKSKKDIMWKDSVIMFHERIMRSQTYDEALENITEGFVNYLPFDRCALFSYSYNEQMGFGLYGHKLDIEAIQNITEDITKLPIIKNNLKLLEMFGKNINYLQPVYLEDASLGFPLHYVKQFQLKSIVLVPIFTSSTNKLLGAAILDQGPNHYFKVSKETFTALIKFGQSAGEILAKFYERDPQQISGNKVKSIHFSPREVEVLKLMAEGASTSEAAFNLNLSEYTVRDYISSIMQKMDARNRTEAVARAIREGVI